MVRSSPQPATRGRAPRAANRVDDDGIPHEVKDFRISRAITVRERTGQVETLFLGMRHNQLPFSNAVRKRWNDGAGIACSLALNPRRKGVDTFSVSASGVMRKSGAPETKIS